MKKLLAIAALAIVIAAPAFAQQNPNNPNRQPSRLSQQQRSTVPSGDIYRRNNNLNPDFQLGGSRWKTNKAKRARHGSVKRN
jgi:opacity protein-like surface antigen